MAVFVLLDILILDYLLPSKVTVFSQINPREHHCSGWWWYIIWQVNVLETSGTHM